MAHRAILLDRTKVRHDELHQVEIGDFGVTENCVGEIGGARQRRRAKRKKEGEAKGGGFHTRSYGITLLPLEALSCIGVSTMSGATAFTHMP
jgi:hypothetical protein